MKVTSIVILTVLVIVGAEDKMENSREVPHGVPDEKGFSSPEGKDQHNNDVEVLAKVADEGTGEKKVVIVSECSYKNKNIVHLNASQFEEGPLQKLKKSNKPNTIEIDWPPEED